VLEDQTIAVIGGGLMGHGIAQTMAEAGAQVAVYDAAPTVLETVVARVQASLVVLDRDAAAAERISVHPTLVAAVADADVVFEAGPEDAALKRSIFADLDRCAPQDAILATNTSVIPVSSVAAAAAHRERIVGTHWWNPPYLIPLVEVVEGAETSPEVIARTLELLRAAGKSPVHVRRDVPGFVGNRLQHALWREAVALVADGVCDAETVDTVVKQSFGLRLPVLGPLENADLVGLDLTLAIHENVLPDLDRTPGPSPFLRKLVGEGKLGMKSGEGFRHWAPGEADRVRQALTAHLRSSINPQPAGALAGATPTEESSP
jgi:3-hydroxybutyryl-CoA dehydrogenase